LLNKIGPCPGGKRVVGDECLGKERPKKGEKRRANFANLQRECLGGGVGFKRSKEVERAAEEEMDNNFLGLTKKREK